MKNEIVKDSTLEEYEQTPAYKIQEMYEQTESYKIQLQQMYEQTESYEEPTPFTLSYDEKLLCEDGCDDYWVSVFQQKYSELNGKILSKDYIKAISPLLGSSLEYCIAYDLLDLATILSTTWNIEKYGGKERLAIITNYHVRLVNIVKNKIAHFNITHQIVPFIEILSKFSPTMTDEEFIALCTKLDKIIFEAQESEKLRAKLNEAEGIFDTLSVLGPEAKEYAAECIIKMENTPKFEEYFRQEISKLPNMMETKKLLKKSLS